jgi:hypothetical protein
MFPFAPAKAGAQRHKGFPLGILGPRFRDAQAGTSDNG